MSVVEEAKEEVVGEAEESAGGLSSSITNNTVGVGECDKTNDEIVAGAENLALEDSQPSHSEGGTGEMEEPESALENGRAPQITVHEMTKSDSEFSATDTTNPLLSHKLQTIATYKSLVGNRKNHSLLLQEATVSGFLVLCLGDDDPVVVEASFEVFTALARHQENLPELRNLDYFMDALRCVATNKRVTEHLRTNAKSLIGELKPPQPGFKAPAQQPLLELSESMRNKMLVHNNANSGSNANSSFTIGDGGGSGGKPSIRNPVDLNSTMSTMKRKNKGRETILYIEGDVIHKKPERAKITQSLISLPGIISVTYDLKRNHCVVRGKRNVASDVFARSVAALGFANVYIVRKNENKEEIKLQVIADDKENLPFPTYPEEVDEDVDNGSAVTTKEQLDAEGKSFFKSAKNFIKRSFYW